MLSIVEPGLRNNNLVFLEVKHPLFMTHYSCPCAVLYLYLPLYYASSHYICNSNVHIIRYKCVTAVHTCDAVVKQIWYVRWQVCYNVYLTKAFLLSFLSYQALIMAVADIQTSAKMQF